MIKFETIWNQPGAFVLGIIKSTPKAFVLHGVKFVSHTIVGGLTHAGKVVLKVVEEAATFAWETLKDLGNEFAEGFNDVLEAGVTEATEAENLKVSLAKLVTSDIADDMGDAVLVGLNQEDLDLTMAAAAA